MKNDEELWHGLRSGDRECFFEIYKKYYHVLLFTGLKEINDPSLVKDTIQHLFLYLWEKRETIQQASNVRSYLVTSFRRKLNTDWKTSRKSGSLALISDDYSNDQEPNPEEKMVRNEEKSNLSLLLMHQINQLPGRQKELIIQRFYEGNSYEEIAQNTGLSLRTVYNKIHEGIKKLRLDLGKSRFPGRVALLLPLIFSMHLVNSILQNIWNYLKS
jgi:RNA polymerase sigma-70 factor (ECF subfamily)